MLDWEDPESVRRQVRLHVQGLRSAGVEWLPLGSPVEMARKRTSRKAAADEPAPLLQSEPGADAADPNTPPREDAAQMTLEERRVALKLVADKVSTCPRCPELVATRTQT